VSARRAASPDAAASRPPRGISLSRQRPQPQSAERVATATVQAVIRVLPIPCINTFAQGAVLLAARAPRLCLATEHNAPKLKSQNQNPNWAGWPWLCNTYPLPYRVRRCVKYCTRNVWQRERPNSKVPSCSGSPGIRILAHTSVPTGLGFL
jgi:hypothetical protein